MLKFYVKFNFSAATARTANEKYVKQTPYSQLTVTEAFDLAAVFECLDVRESCVMKHVIRTLCETKYSYEHLITSRY